MKKKLQIFVTMLKMELRLFVHSWWLWGILFIMFLYLASGYYAFFIIERDYGQLLQSSAFIVMGSILLGIFAGILFSQRERKVKFEEVLETYPSHMFLPLGKLGAWFLIASLFVIISIFLMLTAYISVGSQLLLFWKTTVAYIMVYWGISFFSAGLIGYALDKIIHSSWKYVIALLVWQLTSPYNTYLPERISFLFNQGQESPNGAYDYFGGLNVGIEIVLRHLFFLLLASILVLLAILIHYRFQKRHRLFILSIAIIIILLGVSLIPYSNHKTDWNTESVYNISDEDYMFYDNLSQNKTFQNKILSNFKVEGYNINLNHHKETISYIADIDISIPENTKLDKLYFTLYHDLKVVGIEKQGEDIKWEQEEDWLCVQWNKDTHEGTITIEVCGTTGYRNRISKEAFFLSSGFAWYPIAGKHILADKTLLWNVQYRTLNYPYSVKFDIKVNSHNKVYSNLSDNDLNQFRGEDYGVTLIYGRLLKSEIDDITIIAPPDMAVSARDIYNHIYDSMEIIKQNIQVDKNINCKYIFVVPLYYYLGLNAFPIEYTQDQLFISAHDLKVFDKRHFVKEDFVLPTFYWFDKYHDVDNRVPIVLTCLYNKLYGNQSVYTFEILIERSKYYNIKAEEDKLLEIAQNIIELYDKSDEENLEKMLIDFFALAEESKLNLDVIEEYINRIKFE